MIKCSRMTQITKKRKKIPKDVKKLFKNHLRHFMSTERKIIFKLSIIEENIIPY